MKKFIAVILVACFTMSLFAGEISLKYNSKNEMSTKWTPMLDGEKISREYFYELVGREDLSVAEVKKNAKMKAAYGLCATGLALECFGLFNQIINGYTGGILTNSDLQFVSGVVLLGVGFYLGFEAESETTYSIKFATSLIDTHKLAVGATISK